MKSLSIRSYSYLLASSLLAGLLSSCAPTVTGYRLEPVSGDVAMIDGRAVTKAEQNGVGVVASFEREDMDFIVLDVEIKNHTDRTIVVNPADFHFVGLDAKKDTLAEPNNSASAVVRVAADPSYEAGRLDYKRKQEQNRLKRAKVLNTILMVATVVSDASSSSRSRSYGEYTSNRVTHNLAYQGIAIKRAIDHETFANRMQRYDYEEYRWRELALKTNSLAAGESVRGFVYLHKIQNAQFLALTYSLPEQSTVPLLFKQETVQQKTNRRRR